MNPSPDLDSALSKTLLFLTAVCLALGIYARFKGLGFAPIAIDEYYLSRAIDNVLKYGVPAYDCGGYYQRGLLLQYLAAGLRLAGMSAELAPRVLAAVGSLLSLPAIFIVARRFLSTNGALIVISVLSVSLWQIEIARFGRFYAPFIGLFAWYLVYFLRYTVDRDRRAWKFMLVFTIIGAFVFEGAIFLALANLIPVLLTFAETNRLKKQQWMDLVVCVLLGAALYVSATVDARFASDIPPYPAGYSSAVIETPVRKLDLIDLSFLEITQSPVWIVLLLTIAAASAFAARWIWQWRDKPVTMLGLIAMLGAALLHQFAIVVAVPVVLLLLKQSTLAELRQRRAGVFAAVLSLIAAFWLAYGYVTTDWPQVIAEAGSLSKALAIFIYQYIRYPTLLSDVAMPFATSVPIFGALMFAGCGVAVAWQIGCASELRSAERVLTLLLLLLLLAVGFSDPPRQETRYVAFLHQLMVLITVGVTLHLLDFIRAHSRTIRWAEWIVTASVSAVFVLSEDFNLRHILTIDTPQSAFRRNFSTEMQAHLGEARDDFRAIGTWLQEHAEVGQDIVINAVHGVDYYFPRMDYLFVEIESSNFYDWSCQRGQVDRWTNLPLIYTLDDLLARTANARTTYLVTWTAAARQLVPLLAERNARVVLEEGGTAIIAIKGAKILGDTNRN